MYEEATTEGQLKNCISKEFDVSVRVGMHHGSSVLRLLLFIIVREALSNRFKQGLPCELLYFKYLVLVAESEENIDNKMEEWY